MKNFITGGTGFLGTKVINNLLNNGEEVWALARNVSKAESNLSHKNLHWLEGDVTDKTSLDEAFKNEYDYVIHGAGVIGYKPSMRQMMENVNVNGTQNLLDCLHSTQVKRFVQISSVVAVGAGFTKNDLLNEQSPFNMGSYNLGYFDTKRRAEELTLQAYKDDQLPTISVNPSTIYGEGDGVKGSRGIQKKVAKGKFPFYTSGGVSIIGLDECVEAIINARTMGRLGERYILSGENITIKELFRLIAHHAGVKAPTIFLPNPVVKSIGLIGDLMQSMGKQTSIASENSFVSTLFHWFSNEKAKKDLGLKTRPASESIKESVESMKKMGLL